MNSPTKSTNSDTPETDALKEKHGRVMQFNEILSFSKAQNLLCQKLERERNEALALCRWGFRQLRSICNDYGIEGTAAQCVDRIADNPRIFNSGVVECRTCEGTGKWIDDADCPDCSK